jgi:uncharacterized small protein (DUF1192 family)
MNADKFNERLKALIGEVEMSALNTPTEAVIAILHSEIARLETNKTRFMHEMQLTY